VVSVRAIEEETVRAYQRELMMTMVVEHGHLRLDLNDTWCSEMSAAAAGAGSVIGKCGRLSSYQPSYSHEVSILMAIIGPLGR
jgi:hypothetical protein